MIITNPANRLHVAEFIQEGNDLLLHLTNADPVLLLYKKQFDGYKKVFDEINEVYKQSLSSPLTKILFELDAKRDDIFMGIGIIADGNFKSWKPTVKANAKLIIDSINVFGRSLTVANYQSESAMINSLIDKWETKPDLTAALIALHLDDWKDELKSTNQLFVKTYNERSESNAETNALNTIKNLREKANTAWNKLTNVINGKIEEFEDDEIKAPLYEKLVNNINQVFENYDFLLSQRQGRKAAKDETPVTPPEKK